MESQIVLFTMEGCPYCHDFKKMLNDNDLVFTELDINENQEEYDMFVQITGNDFVPAFMIVDPDGEEAEFFAPDRDYEDLDQAMSIIIQKVR